MNIVTDDETLAEFSGGHVNLGFAPIEAAIEAIRRGEMVVVVDDEDRENEGDLIMAAEKATTADVAFFLHHTSGFLCTAITTERAQRLGLDPMVAKNTESMRTAFLVSVDYLPGTTTGISASDRAATIRALADRELDPGDLARPGHILPLEARPGGVLKRTGHTEAAVDLAVLAGLEPAGLLCEIVTGDKAGMARVDELHELAATNGLLVITIADLVRYRQRTEKLVSRTSTIQISTEWGEFTCHSFQSTLDGAEHLVCTVGDLDLTGGAALVRMHTECVAGDVFGSRHCDCGQRLRDSMRLVAASGSGAVVYVRGHADGRVGLGHQPGTDAPHGSVDEGGYGIGAQILADLGITTLRLLASDDDDDSWLRGFGINIVERVTLGSTMAADRRPPEGQG